MSKFQTIVECTFVVGQKVIFVGPGAFSRYPSNYIRLIRGRIYTVREVRPDGSKVGILTQEVVNPPCWALSDYGKEVFAEVAVPHFEFRPTKETKTDISVFKELLKETETV